MSFYSYVLSLNPVAYWRMNDSSTATFNEEIGSLGSPTWSGTPIFGEPGSTTDEDTAIRFDGTGYVTVPHHADLNGSGPYSWLFAFKRENYPPRDEVLFHKANPGVANVPATGTGYTFVLRTSGKLQVNVRGSSTNFYQQETGDLCDGQWHLILAVNLNTAVPSRIYVDSPSSPIVGGASAPGAVTTTGDLVFGINPAYDPINFNLTDGVLDEVAFFDYAITDPTGIFTNWPGSDALEGWGMLI